uniref:Putative origin recognition complex subunit 6 n=1 Tax=Xenopsylla cheopis TaxID=163159 RepID=A0A6M2DQU0_XENCH
MASGQKTMVQMMAQKLGFNENKPLINKANELMRLLKMKSLGGNAITLSDSAQSVICLDLASSSIGISFDVDHAIKLSGVKRNTYLSGLRTIEKLLDLAKELTVNELCVQLGVTSIKEKADLLLTKYKNSHNCDVTHPQYVAMAVFQACRVGKIKVQRNMIIPFSRLKPSQWSILEKSWSTWVDDKLSTLLKESSEESKDNFSEDTNKDTNTSTPSFKTAEIEDYEVWKKRILEEAYRELELRNNSFMEVV